MLIMLVVHMLVLHHVQLRGEGCDVHVHPPSSRQRLAYTIHTRVRFTLQLEA